MLRLLLCAVLLQFAAPEGAHSANGVLLIAKPDLVDPNFERTVVLVTQTEDSSTVGVIINRPILLRPAEIVGDDLDTSRYRDPVFAGGPVMRGALVAVFHADQPPAAAAFHVLRNLYMSMHPDNIRLLLASEGRQYRLYAGFSGWAPRQLMIEFEREGWFVLPADEETVFRRDTGGLWEELAERAQALKTRTRQ